MRSLTDVIVLIGTNPQSDNDKFIWQSESTEWDDARWMITSGGSTHVLCYCRYIYLSKTIHVFVIMAVTVFVNFATYICQSCKERVAPSKQINFRKRSKGGWGGHFQSKKLYCRFWNFIQGFLSMIFQKKSTRSKAVWNFSENSSITRPLLFII